ncbi:MAG: tetratricopeptide (TPR) repeat protein [Candidatus Azotimanducaceae bacterium]|jgi:tetratricopeptide (TPR) repeat protein
MKHFVKTLVGMFIATMVVAFNPATISTAVAADEKKKEQKTRRVPSMSESIYKKLAEAQEAVDLKDYDLALEVLQEMLDRSRRYNGNEVGQVHNMMGYVWFLKENYLKAIEEYALVVAQGEDIPEGLETTTLYTLAQLSFVEDKYDDALMYMETWIEKATNPGPAPRIFLGQVYYQMKDYVKAIVQLEMAIAISVERNTPVKENTWQLVNFLYFEQEDWPKVIETLEILVRDFPKRDYWVRLAGIYGQEGNEKGHLNTLQAAYIAEFLTKETDLTNLAGLLMQDELPYPAAVVLEKGLEDEIVETSAKNLRALGQAWQLAHEVDKAIPVYESAAKLSDDGKIFERLAYLYLEADKFDMCVRAANGALNKGGLSKRQNTYIVRGMCLFNKDSLDDARGSFVSCRNESRKKKDESNTRVCAQWITYIDREKDRLAALAAAG